MTLAQRQENARPRRQYRRGAVYTAMAIFLFLIALPLWWFTISRSVHLDPGTWKILPVVGLVAAYLACEFLPLRIEVRHETTMITLTEIPMVVGLLANVAPPLVGLANLVAALLVYVIRRDTWRYLILNVVIILVETGMVVACFVAVQGHGTPTQQRGFEYLALLVGHLSSTLLPTIIVSKFHGLLGSPDPVGPAVVRSLITSGATTTFGLVGYTLWAFKIQDSTTTGRILCIGLAVAIVVLYRIYARFLRQHLDLSRMYEFGRRVSGVGTGITEWQALLEQVRDQLNAQVAMVHMVEPNDVFQTLAVGPDGPVDGNEPAGDDPILAQAAQSGGLQVSTDRSNDPRVLEALTHRGAWDVLIAPLKSGDRSRGFLEVRNRRSRWGRFSGNDLRLLETQARTIATELDNQRLLATLRHEAHHDTITGLLNWRGLIFQTETALAHHTTSAVLLVQLGVLSEVNNAVGHERGEQLLTGAGRRLVGALGSERVVAHLESDRFGVLVETQGEAEVEQVALHLLDLVSQTYSLDGIEVEPHAQAGIAFVDYSEGEAQENAGELMQRAEMALTAAQASDVPLRSYGTNMGEAVRRRFQLVTQFRRAVEQGLITVQYQPKVSLADNELVGMEALVRWAHPEFGPVSPAEFVEAIEATGSIDILLEHVLDIVLEQIAVWVKRNMRIGVAVNLSVRNLSAPNFPAKVRGALALHDVAPELLTFEITESSVMADPERSLPVLNELHAMGIKLSVDDFGTGYSSLAYLRRLPIDEIKIDKSFVQGMVTDLGDLAIVRAIIDLGHSLGLRVVAEGVEEEAARDALRTLSCDDLQGYLLSRPQPIEKLESWLTTRTMRSMQDSSRPEILRLIVG